MLLSTITYYIKKKKKEKEKLFQFDSDTAWVSKPIEISLLHRTCFSLKPKLLKTEEIHTHIHIYRLPIPKN